MGSPLATSVSRRSRVEQPDGSGSAGLERHARLDDAATGFAQAANLAVRLGTGETGGIKPPPNPR